MWRQVAALQRPGLRTKDSGLDEHMRQHEALPMLVLSWLVFPTVYVTHQHVPHLLRGMHGMQDWSNRNGRPRFAVAHLQGALRRMDVRNPDEYVEAEYAVAAKDFVAAASDIASHCRYPDMSYLLRCAVFVGPLVLKDKLALYDSGDRHHHASHCKRA